MKGKIDWVLVVIVGYALLMITAGVVTSFFAPRPPDGARWDEAAKDGWTFVGRTERGTAIRKKYFKEHGVWIFVTATGPESMSAVPLEILERTDAGDSYKGKK